MLSYAQERRICAIPVNYGTISVSKIIKSGSAFFGERCVVNWDKKPHSYMDRPDAFAAPFTADTFAGNTPRTSILSTLAPDLDTTVSATSIPQVQGDKVGAAAQAGVVQRAAVTVKQDATACMGAITETIRQAQKEIGNAAKACGVQPQDLWKDERIAPNSEIGLLPSLVGEMKGLGTFASFMKKASLATDVELVARDMSKGASSPEEAKSRIASKLAEMSAQGPQDTRQSTAAIISDKPKQEMDKPKLDWETTIETHGPEVLDQIMALDPENPNPDIIPEFDDARRVAAIADRALDTAQTIENETVDMGRDNTKAVVNSGWSRNDEICAKASAAGEMLSCYSGVKPDGAGVFSSVKDAGALLAMEFDPRQMGLDPGLAAPRMG